MANELNKFNINKLSFNIVDENARNLISELDEKKSDKFDVSFPLSFNRDGKLCISLEDYYTKEALDVILDNKFNEVNSEQNVVYEKIDSICNILKNILGEDKITNNNDNISYDSNIPSLEDASTSIENININLATLDTSLNDKINNLNTNLNTLISDLDDRLTTNLNNKGDEIETLKNRCAKLENEVFKVYETEPTESKIDEMYNKVDIMYKALINYGLIKETI